MTERKQSGTAFTDGYNRFDNWCKSIRHQAEITIHCADPKDITQALLITETRSQSYKEKFQKGIEAVRRDRKNGKV